VCEVMVAELSEAGEANEARKDLLGTRIKRAFNLLITKTCVCTSSLVRQVGGHSSMLLTRHHHGDRDGVGCGQSTDSLAAIMDIHEECVMRFCLMIACWGVLPECREFELRGWVWGGVFCMVDDPVFAPWSPALMRGCRVVCDDNGVY